MQTPPPLIVVVVGDTNADVSFALGAWPDCGSDGQARATDWGSGGSALNVACAFAELGAEAVLVSSVGTDPLAAVALAEARRRGVVLSRVQRTRLARTGLCVVGVDDRGERTFLSHRGANTKLRPRAAQRVLEGASLLHLSAYALLESPQADTALGLMEQAVEQGIRVSLDLAGPPAEQCGERILELSPRLWALYGNEQEFRLLGCGRSERSIVEQLISNGVQVVAIKRGDAGCTIAHAGDRGRWHSARPVEVGARDTTGCGDAFVAGCGWALLRGASVRVAASLGNLVGALTAERAGAAGAFPSRAELAARASGPIGALLGARAT